jgi:hypothetical protein
VGVLLPLSLLSQWDQRTRWLASVLEEIITVIGLLVGEKVDVGRGVDDRINSTFRSVTILEIVDGLELQILRWQEGSAEFLKRTSQARYQLIVITRARRWS